MMETKTPKEFLEKVLPARFNADKAAGIDVVAQINITGTEGGNWAVTIRDQKLQVTEGVTPSPTVTVQMSKNDFLDIVNGKLSAESAFLSGKVHFEGRLSLALKLRDAGIL
jgi:putative sterol carrier protein